jgi:hypothetical protein
VQVQAADRQDRSTEGAEQECDQQAQPEHGLAIASTKASSPDALLLARGKSAKAWDVFFPPHPSPSSSLRTHALRLPIAGCRRMLRKASVMSHRS